MAFIDEISRTLPDEVNNDTNKWINKNRHTGGSANYLHIVNADLAEIYWRGQYLIIVFAREVVYWEHSGGYLLKAIEVMDLENPEEWKTIGKIIALRQAIREMKVNGSVPLEDYLNDGVLNLKRYELFMQQARKYDKMHHGEHTF